MWLESRARQGSGGVPGHQAVELEDSGPRGTGKANEEETCVSAAPSRELSHSAAGMSKAALGIPLGGPFRAGVLGPGSVCRGR